VSLSRHGLNLLRQLTRPLTPPEDPLARMVETILNWIARQLARNQLLKIVGRVVQKLNESLPNGVTSRLRWSS